MAAKRAGTIIHKPSGYFARVWIDAPDGSSARRWVNLQTTDMNTAKQTLSKLVRQIEHGDGDWRPTDDELAREKRAKARLALVAAVRAVGLDEALAIIGEEF